MQDWVDGDYDWVLILFLILALAVLLHGGEDDPHDLDGFHDI